MEFLKGNIMTGSKLLGFYVQDLLDLAQIRSGKIVKNIERVDINEVLREILQT
jgi:K+-sensing histidine kinase KdpD